MTQILDLLIAERARIDSVIQIYSAEAHRKNGGDRRSTTRQPIWILCANHGQARSTLPIQ